MAGIRDPQRWRRQTFPWRIRRFKAITDFTLSAPFLSLLCSHLCLRALLPSRSASPKWGPKKEAQGKMPGYSTFLLQVLSRSIGCSSINPALSSRSIVVPLMLGLAPFVFQDLKSGSTFVFLKIIGTPHFPPSALELSSPLELISLHNIPSIKNIKNTSWFLTDPENLHQRALAFPGKHEGTECELHSTIINT